MSLDEKTQFSNQLIDCQLNLPASAWILYSGSVHITNNRSLLIYAKDLNGYVIDSFNDQTKFEFKSVGDIYLEFSNNLIIYLQHVYYVPKSNYNLISQYQLCQDFTFSLNSKGGDILIKQANDMMVEISFLKIVEQNWVLLTKEPSIESIIEYSINNKSIKSSSSSEKNDQDQQVAQNLNQKETIQNLKGQKFIELIEDYILKSIIYIKGNKKSSFKLRLFLDQIKEKELKQLKDRRDLKLKIVYSIVKISNYVENRSDFITNIIPSFYEHKLIDKETYLNWYNENDQTVYGNDHALKLMENFIQKILNEQNQQISPNFDENLSDQKFIESLREYILKSIVYSKGNKKSSFKLKLFMHQIKEKELKQLRSKSHLKLKVIYLIVEISNLVENHKDFITNIIPSFYEHKLIDKGTYWNWYTQKDQTIRGNEFALKLMENFIKKINYF